MTSTPSSPQSGANNSPNSQFRAQSSQSGSVPPSFSPYDLYLPSQNVATQQQQQHITPPSRVAPQNMPQMQQQASPQFQSQQQAPAQLNNQQHQPQYNQQPMQQQMIPGYEQIYNPHSQQYQSYQIAPQIHLTEKERKEKMRNIVFTQRFMMDLADQKTVEWRYSFTRGSILYAYFTPIACIYLLYKGRSQPQFALAARNRLIAMPLVTVSLLLYSSYMMGKDYDRLAEKYQLTQLSNNQLLNYGALGLSNLLEQAAVESPMNYQNMQYNVQMAQSSPLSQEEMRQSLESMPSSQMQGYGHVTTHQPQMQPMGTNNPSFQQQLQINEIKSAPK